MKTQVKPKLKYIYELGNGIKKTFELDEKEAKEKINQLIEYAEKEKTTLSFELLTFTGA
jgi:hypothetical protein